MDAIEQLVQSTRSYIKDHIVRPESTYRLQFHAGFRFADAQAQSDYFHTLGVSHCYASPYLRARPGSTHGYDIIDHGQLNPEIGTPAEFDEWVSSLKRRGLGHILDIVPNHMGVATNDNSWWNDVLENGPSSRFGEYFDIAWQASQRPELRNKVLLPVLGDFYGDVLEAGQLQVRFEAGAFYLEYFDRHFPLSPNSYSVLLGEHLPELESALKEQPAELAEYISIITACKNLPAQTETDPALTIERAREKEVIKRRLDTLCKSSELVRHFIDSNLTKINGTVGQPHTFDQLDTLLEQQCFRLSFWRVAPDEINYRRFFDINDLAALSMEKKDVFRAAHALPFKFLVDEKLDGLRIDHPDGLYDPAGYFRDLQEQYLMGVAEKIFQSSDPEGEGGWSQIEGDLRERFRELIAAGGKELTPLYVVAEKILGADERLVESWHVHGTSGYDFVNTINGLFVDGSNASKFSQHYVQWVDDDTRYSELVYRKKILILQISLASELNTLAYQLDRLAQKSRKSRDFTLNNLRRALREVVACFPVYRSYIADEGPNETDRKHIDIAVRRARARNPLISRTVFDFIRQMLVQQSPDSFTEADRAEQRRFAGKFQQVTAPVTAKGIEDTAFYIYNRLISLNEVGGEPNRFGTTAQAVHEFNAMRQAHWPYALSPLSTHDTKRSEDVRARINVLSEVPDEWHAALARWTEMNEENLVRIDDELVPGRNEQCLLYQTLVGAWPIRPMNADDHQSFVQRIVAYMEKALHEAKVHTSWINPNEEYDRAVQNFVERLLDAKSNAEFLADFQKFQRSISYFGFFNSLSQTLLKITCPGVPDTYQGTELWDFSLVDPDNRRPVDYRHRGEMLRQLREQFSSGSRVELARQLMSSLEDGRSKLLLTHLALTARNTHPGLFSVGEYVPLEASGGRGENVFAFIRSHEHARSLVVVPRLITKLTSAGELPLGETVWSDTHVRIEPPYDTLKWTNVLTGEQCEVESGSRHLSLSKLLAHFPVALCIAEGEPEHSGSVASGT